MLLTRLVLPRSVGDLVVAEAERALPLEACGLLVGQRSEDRVRVVEALSCLNVHQGDRRHRFEIEPRRILEAQRAARERALELVGVYHSHPGNAAEPSARDRESAWSDLAYVIVGFPGAEPSSAELRSWTYVSALGEFCEDKIEYRSS